MVGFSTLGGAVLDIAHILIFYREKTWEEIIEVVVTLLAQGCPVNAVVAAFGSKEETVRTWYRRRGDIVNKYTST